MRKKRLLIINLKSYVTYKQAQEGAMAKNGKSMAMPRDAAKGDGMGNETQMYHMGKSYYGEGYGDTSNLSNNVVMREYPKSYRSLEANAYPDTLREIDEDARFNMQKVDEWRSDSMY